MRNWFLQRIRETGLGWGRRVLAMIAGWNQLTSRFLFLLLSVQVNVLFGRGSRRMAGGARKELQNERQEREKSTCCSDHDDDRHLFDEDLWRKGLRNRS
jgi:hypothetical protein